MLQLWVHVYFLTGLCSASEFQFHSCNGEGTPAAQTAGERSCSHFPICIPRRFCLIQVSWGSEGCNPSRAQGVVVHQVENGQRDGLQSRNMLEKQSARKSQPLWNIPNSLQVHGEEPQCGLQRDAWSWVHMWSVTLDQSKALETCYLFKNFLFYTSLS